MKSQDVMTLFVNYYPLVKVTIMLNKHRVLLPKWIFTESTNDKELNKLVLNYMCRYPDYVFRYIENGFAICERIETK
ncbi:hypothetical protein [Virgibacillus oceani]|uniref:Uncharacterized protein n=1 Tax=Virgibacillus oceani TaxID=1479511 RepID=A0A917H1G5_9BACI|nr:hypothetical protein [Virgibacillus oceani]GGG64527.1 hypothetical protein GCM10011398_05160 [Virgibacillus oceani]